MQDQIVKTLMEMSEKMDSVVNLLQVIVELIIPEPAPDIFGLTGVQKEIFALCDGKHDIKTISETIGKNSRDVNKALTRLKRKGLVRLVDSTKRSIYSRVPLWWVRTPQLDKKGKSAKPESKKDA